MLNKDVLLHELNIKPGELDMSISGEPAKMFMVALIEMFEQNGGKNFLTTTVHYKDVKYSITIENCNGVDTPAEKLVRMQTEIDRSKEEKTC